jgi:hypothetical protein
MALALLGNRSIISLELFRYIFPHANVSYNNSRLSSKTDFSDDTSFDKNSNEYVQSCLDAIMAAISKDEDHTKSCGGKSSYKTDDGTVVF